MNDSAPKSAKPNLRVRVRNRSAEAAAARIAEQNQQAQHFELSLVDDVGYDPYGKARPTPRERRKP